MFAGEFLVDEIGKRGKRRTVRHMVTVDHDEP